MIIREQLQQRNLPPLGVLAGPPQSPAAYESNRRNVKKLLCEHEYGFIPPAPIKVEAEVISVDARFCAGHAPLQRVMLRAVCAQWTFSFPIWLALPKSESPVPVFIHINFDDSLPNRYCPAEEICDRGFGIASLYYKDITSDDGDFQNGLAGLLYREGRTDPAAAGKIAMWAWAAMRVMDYLITLPQVDSHHVAVVGHSRLGKTALLTGAFDERFALTISNDSGCSGAALSRGNRGETIQDIVKKFPYWFCPRYAGYANRVQDLPFDQHDLLSLVAPRLLYVASAQEDSWADPASEFLCCQAADEAYRFFGESGLEASDTMPTIPAVYPAGKIGYHLRPGLHYLSRHDWLYYMDFFELHLKI